MKKKWCRFPTWYVTDLCLKVNVRQGVLSAGNPLSLAGSILKAHCPNRPKQSSNGDADGNRQSRDTQSHVAHVVTQIRADTRSVVMRLRIGGWTMYYKYILYTIHPTDWQIFLPTIANISALAPLLLNRRTLGETAWNRRVHSTNKISLNELGSDTPILLTFRWKLISLHVFHQFW